MKFKFYLRKSSFKKDLDSASILLSEIDKYKPLNFLEVGVYQGVTSRNICEKLNEIHKKNFKFFGIDLFEDTNQDLDKKEMTVKHNKLSNPFKHLLYNVLLKKDLNSIESVNGLLKKFSQNVQLLKGLSQIQLKNIDLSIIDFVFLDGGHSYETVKSDLNLITKSIKKNKIIICDDYDQKTYGVKKAVDEYFGKVTEIKDLNGRLVRITT
tara:strand:- start:427 stop:1056 length:630 start_codon:yes stop_codon:yes gene_type:complete